MTQTDLDILNTISKPEEILASPIRKSFHRALIEQASIWQSKGQRLAIRQLRRCINLFRLDEARSQELDMLTIMAKRS